MREVDVLECIALLGRPRRSDIFRVLMPTDLMDTYKDEHSFVISVNIMLKRLEAKGLIKEYDLRWTTTEKGETHLKISQYRDLLEDPEKREAVKEIEKTIRSVVI